jgi:hypothetical protein
MARRTPPRIFDLSPYGGAPMVNFSTGRVTRRRGKRLVGNPLATPGEYRLRTQGGLRILRNQRTNTMGVRDLVVDRSGRVVANLRTGSNPQLRMVGEGPSRRLVVGRAGAPAPSAAPTGGGAGRSVLAGVTDDPNLYRSANDPVLWRGRNQPNQNTLNQQFGQGNWYVDQDEDGTYIVRRRDNSPYAMYNDYPFVRRYLEGLDTGYNQFKGFIDNTLTPQLTQAAKDITAMRLSGGNAYNTAIQNYAGSAGQVASAITTPQVAGMTGGTVVAPNQNALAAQQGIAAAATAGRGLDAAARTSMGALSAEADAGRFLSQYTSYAAGLLNQYGQKRTQERLKLDQWIQEQKDAQQKYELDLARLDQSMINSLIVSGDRAAARDVTTRGQDLTDARAQADDARQADIDRGLRPSDLLNDFIKVPKGAGAKWRNRPGAQQDINGDWWIPKKSGGRSGGGSGGSGSTPKPKVVNKASLDKVFRSGFAGVPPETYPGGTARPGTGKQPAWRGDRARKRRAAAIWIVKNRRNFVGLTKADATVVRTWLAGFDFLNTQDVESIISQVKQQL